MQPELPLHSGERRHGQVVAAHVVFGDGREAGTHGGFGARWVTGGGDGGESDHMKPCANYSLGCYSLAAFPCKIKGMFLKFEGRKLFLSL